MTEPNYQCQILEEKTKKNKKNPKIKKIKIWNDYSSYYMFVFILTFGLIYFYYKTKNTYFFYNSDGNIKYVITCAFVCIMAIGAAGVWIKNAQMKMLTSKKDTKNIIMKYITSKKKKKKKKNNVNSDKKKLVAEIIICGYMIFVGLIGVVAQKFGKK
jgi:hypothetical protein